MSEIDRGISVGRWVCDVRRKLRARALLGARFAEGAEWALAEIVQMAAADGGGRRGVPRRHLYDRFDEKVMPEPMSGCWLWIGSVGRHGHGRIARGGRHGGTALAHRVSYRRYVGPIPDGTEIDHLCRNPCCVNPAHLEAVTHRVNVLRSTSPFAENAKRTHCPLGHPYSGDNVGMRADRYGRRCRECDRAKKRRRLEERRRGAL